MKQKEPKMNLFSRIRPFLKRLFSPKYRRLCKFRREIGRKGGLRSGEVRRLKAIIRYLDDVFETDKEAGYPILKEALERIEKAKRLRIEEFWRKERHKYPDIMKEIEERAKEFLIRDGLKSLFC